MGERFYHDLDEMGRQFGLTKQLQFVFNYQNQTANQGVEHSAPLHVLEYYTPTTVRKVLEYVAVDYVMLNMTLPKWARDMMDSKA